MKYFWLAFTAAVFIFLVNILGFIDTMTGSLMGCGTDYPFCNGHIYPNFHDYHSIIEYTHRFVVGMASILLFTVSAISWFRYKSHLVKWLAFFAILGILGESTLGALTVIMTLSPALLAAHLGTALISFAALTNMAYVIYQKEKRVQYIENMPVSLSTLSWFSFGFLYLAIYFGGYVAKTGAGGAFKGFPFPTETYATTGMNFWIDVVHRSFALGLIILFIILNQLTKKYRHIQNDLHMLSWVCLVLILLQGLSGALLIYSHLALWAVILHVSIISLIVGTLSIICFQSQIRSIQTVNKKANSKQTPL